MTILRKHKQSHFYESLRLLLMLHDGEFIDGLTEVGMDNLRDFSDQPWYGMTKEEQELIGKVSAQLIKSHEESKKG